MTSPQAVVLALVERGLTVACAESLTGGLVCAALTSEPGSSRAVRGGVVGYATDVKASVLGVDARRLADVGPVDALVAEQMAVGAARLLGADVGLSTTGVAGPGPSGGMPAGTVYVAASGPWPGGVTSRRLALEGDRTEVREGSVTAVLGLLDELLRGGATSADAKAE